MASERDFELLDDYLANRLSGDERVAFERRMDGDSELKREFTVQQNIVEGIKRARLAELKGMLQNTPVPAPPLGETMLAKIGMVAVVAGLIATGVWFFTRDKQEDIKQQTAPVAEKAADTIAEEPKAAEPSAETGKQEEPAVEEKVEPKKEDKKVKPAEPKKAVPAQDSQIQPIKPQAFEEELTPAEPTVESLERAYGRINNGSSGLEIEPVLDNKKYNFHYQFENGKLLLYGESFSEKSKYEIMEFFENKKRTNVFLFHVDSYYLLDEGNTKITELKPIKDQALVKKLEEFRKN